MTRELRTVDGQTLRTLADVRAYAVALPIQYGTRPQWQAVARLLIEAAETGQTDAASRQTETALFLDMKLRP